MWIVYYDEIISKNGGLYLEKFMGILEKTYVFEVSEPKFENFLLQF